MVINPKCTFGETLKKLKSVHEVEPISEEVLHTDVIVVWSDMPYRVIIGADILGRLLK